MLLMYVLFSYKELLCFHKPLPLFTSDLLEKEKTLVNDQSIKQLKHPGFFTDSCKTLDMKK